MPVDEADIRRILEEEEKSKGPVSETYLGMMSLILGGWIDVASNPEIFTKTAYHCIRRMPSDTLVKALIKNWISGQSTKNRLLAAMCLRYALAKICYDTESRYEEAKCPLCIAFINGLIDIHSEDYERLWTLPQIDDQAMGRAYKDAIIVFASNVNISYDLPPFGTTW